MFVFAKSNFFLIYQLHKIIRKSSSWSSKSVTAFCEIFDVDRNDFLKYRRDYKIPALTVKRIEALSSLRESLKIDKSEWLLYPELVKRSPLMLEQYCLNLNEGGFQTIRAVVLANYGKIVKTKIRYLKANGYLPMHVNVAESYLSHLSPKPQLFIGDLTDDNTLNLTHYNILTRFLMWRLNASYETIQKLFRKFSLAKIWSFKQLCQSIQFAEQLGCTPDKIFQYGHTFKTPPKTIESLLIQVPTLAGLDICKVISSTPYLIRVPPEQLLASYKILKDAQISDQLIQQHLNVFHLKPETIAERIEEAKKVPEFEIFRNHPKFIKLIITHNEARSRLSFLKKLKLRCTSVDHFCCQKQKFNMYVQDGNDLHSSTDVIKFVKTLLRFNGNIISANLKKHLFYRHVSFLSITDSYKYLQELNFSDDAIIDVVQLLLYPRNRLKSAYEASSSYSMDTTTNEAVKLNLILYLIEKEYHFTGNGIWNYTENA